MMGFVDALFGLLRLALWARRAGRNEWGGVQLLEPRRLFSANVLTYHNDAAGDGKNVAETILTPGNVSADFGLLHSVALDGQVYAQPLFVQDVNAERRRGIMFAIRESASRFARLTLDCRCYCEVSAVIGR